MTVVGGAVRGEGTGQKEKWTHRDGQQCDDRWREWGRRGLNYNGKIQ